jgi:hypothetical protein
MSEEMSGASHTASAEDRFRALEEKIAALEASLSRMAEELRTRRLVVGDETTGASVVAEVQAGQAELRVELDSPRGARSSVVIFAHPAEPDEEASLGVQIWADGELKAGATCWQQLPDHWIFDLDAPEQD